METQGHLAVTALPDTSEKNIYIYIYINIMQCTFIVSTQDMKRLKESGNRKAKEMLAI